MILICNSQLTKEPRALARIVQAGETIEGISLCQLLSLLQEFEQLKTNFQKEENLLAFISELITSEQKLLVPFLEEYPELSSKDKEDVFVESLLNFIGKLPPSQRVKDFQDLDINAERNKTTLNITLAKFGLKRCLVAFALLKTWPAIANNRYFSDVVQLPGLFELLQDLFPNLSLKQISTQLPSFIKRINPYNYSALFVASLLSHPSDGKGDNYMVTFRRDNEGQIIDWSIVGIDSDKALANTITQHKADRHFAGVKCILFCLPTITEKIDAEFRTKFLSEPPEIQILNWLGDLYRQQQRYERLCHLNILTAEDCIENSAPTIDIPLKLDPAIVLVLYQNWCQLYQLLLEDRHLSHAQLFAHLEPVLAEYYERITQKHIFPLEVMHKIYFDATLEDVLSPSLDNHYVTTSNGKKTFRLYLQEIKRADRDYERNRNQTVERVIKQVAYVFNYDAILKDENVEKNAKFIYRLFALIVEHFPFIDKLPLNVSQLNQLFLLAVKNSNTLLAKWLLQAGANVNFTDQAGRTALHLAVCLIPTNDSLLTLLLKQPTILTNVYDNRDLTPLFSADHKNTQLLDKLLQAGIDVEFPAGKE